jgi:hypothetical protein
MSGVQCSAARQQKYQQHADEVETLVGAWVAGHKHPLDQVLLLRDRVLSCTRYGTDTCKASRDKAGPGKADDVSNACGRLLLSAPFRLAILSNVAYTPCIVSGRPRNSTRVCSRACIKTSSPN